MGATEVDLSWVHGGNEHRRYRVDVKAVKHERAIASRLHNLAYDADFPEQRLDMYRLSHHAPDEDEETLGRDVRDWHDGGPPPGAQPVQTAPGGAPVSTVCSKIRVDLFRDNSTGFAPHRFYKRRPSGPRPPTHLWKIHLWKGQHSAIVFDDFPGADKLFSGNNLEAVPGPNEGAWKQFKVGKRRVLFYHAYSFTKRMSRAGKPNPKDQEISMLSLRKGCDIFQVRTDTPKFAELKLQGNSVLIYGDKQFQSLPRVYSFGNFFSAFGMTQSEIVQRLDKTVKEDGIIDHLVISAHGGGTATKAALRMGQQDLSVDTAGLWFLLNGKIRYLWLLSCFVAWDQGLMSDLVANIGCKVAAYELQCPLNVKVGPSCIDFHHGRKPWVFEPDGKGGVTSSIDHRKFFMNARRSFKKDDFASGLDFFMKAAR
ncbi:MAG: hypothetical protein RIF41_34170 [Polyangiaceae bacterium]